MRQIHTNTKQQLKRVVDFHVLTEGCLRYIKIQKQSLKSMHNEQKIFTMYALLCKKVQKDIEYVGYPESVRLSTFNFMAFIQFQLFQ